MANDRQTVGSGIGICTVLILIFLVLKLTGNIDWSWWWVFSPYWMCCGGLLSIILIGLLLAALGIGIGMTGKKMRDRMRGKNVSWKFSEKEETVIDLPADKFKDMEEMQEEEMDETVPVDENGDVETDMGEIVEEIDETVADEKELGLAYKSWNYFRQHPEYSDWGCNDKIKYIEEDGILRRT